MILDLDRITFRAPLPSGIGQRPSCSAGSHPLHDTDGTRRQSSQSFDDYAEAQWWAGLIDRPGIGEASKVVETEQEAESGTVLLVE
ncbi:hypothetical protein [Nocardia abscessus]|uniref:hypothetical protein n=1 Tax=Nocardia abscessus TaxID=120957 RepID=UPI0002DC7C31|nr:hypothetical protein [Nocardia abscessus]MCC3333020.1 hypothetical protein [Nocardia abscessus]